MITYNSADCTLKCDGTDICLSSEQMCDGNCDCAGTCSDEQDCGIHKMINIFKKLNSFFFNR